MDSCDSFKSCDTNQYSEEESQTDAIWKQRNQGSTEIAIEVLRQCNTMLSESVSSTSTSFCEGNVKEFKKNPMDARSHLQRMLKNCEKHLECLSSVSHFLSQNLAEMMSEISKEMLCFEDYSLELKTSWKSADTQRQNLQCNSNTMTSLGLQLAEKLHFFRPAFKNRLPKLTEPVAEKVKLEIKIYEEAQLGTNLHIWEKSVKMIEDLFQHSIKTCAHSSIKKVLKPGAELFRDMAEVVKVHFNNQLALENKSQKLDGIREQQKQCKDEMNGQEILTQNLRTKMHTLQMLLDKTRTRNEYLNEQVDTLQKAVSEEHLRLKPSHLQDSFPKVPLSNESSAEEFTPEQVDTLQKAVSEEHLRLKPSHLHDSFPKVPLSNESSAEEFTPEQVDTLRKAVSEEHLHLKPSHLQDSFPQVPLPNESSAEEFTPEQVDTLRKAVSEEHLRLKPSHLQDSFPQVPLPNKSSAEEFTPEQVDTLRKAVSEEHLRLKPSHLQDSFPQVPLSNESSAEKFTPETEQDHLPAPSVQKEQDGLRSEAQVDGIGVDDGPVQPSEMTEEYAENDESIAPIAVNVMSIQDQTLSSEQMPSSVEPHEKEFMSETEVEPLPLPVIPHQEEYHREDPEIIKFLEEKLQVQKAEAQMLKLKMSDLEMEASALEVTKETRLKELKREQIKRNSIDYMDQPVPEEDNYQKMEAPFNTRTEKHTKPRARKFSRKKSRSHSKSKSVHQLSSFHSKFSIRESVIRRHNSAVKLQKRSSKLEERKGDESEIPSRCIERAPVPLKRPQSTPRVSTMGDRRRHSIIERQTLEKITTQQVVKGIMIRLLEMKAFVASHLTAKEMVELARQLERPRLADLKDLERDQMVGVLSHIFRSTLSRIQHIMSEALHMEQQANALQEAKVFSVMMQWTEAKDKTERVEKDYSNLFRNYQAVWLMYLKLREQTKEDYERQLDAASMDSLVITLCSKSICGSLQCAHHVCLDSLLRTEKGALQAIKKERNLTNCKARKQLLESFHAPSGLLTTKCLLGQKFNEKFPDTAVDVPDTWHENTQYMHAAFAKGRIDRQLYVEALVQSLKLAAVLQQKQTLLGEGFVMERLKQSLAGKVQKIVQAVSCEQYPLRVLKQNAGYNNYVAFLQQVQGKDKQIRLEEEKMMMFRTLEKIYRKIKAKMEDTQALSPEHKMVAIPEFVREEPQEALDSSRGPSLVDAGQLKAHMKLARQQYYASTAPVQKRQYSRYLQDNVGHLQTAQEIPEEAEENLVPEKYLTADNIMVETPAVPAVTPEMSTPVEGLETFTFKAFSVSEQSMRSVTKSPAEAAILSPTLTSKDLAALTQELPQRKLQTYPQMSLTFKEQARDCLEVCAPSHAPAEEPVKCKQLEELQDSASHQEVSSAEKELLQSVRDTYTKLEQAEDSTPIAKTVSAGGSPQPVKEAAAKPRKLEEFEEPSTIAEVTPSQGVETQLQKDHTKTLKTPVLELPCPRLPRSRCFLLGLPPLPELPSGNVSTTTSKGTPVTYCKIRDAVLSPAAKTPSASADFLLQNKTYTLSNITYQGKTGVSYTHLTHKQLQQLQEEVLKPSEHPLPQLWHEAQGLSGFRRSKMRQKPFLCPTALQMGLLLGSSPEKAGPEGEALPEPLHLPEIKTHGESYCPTLGRSLIINVRRWTRQNEEEIEKRRSGSPTVFPPLPARLTNLQDFLVEESNGESDLQPSMSKLQASLLDSEDAKLVPLSPETKSEGSGHHCDFESIPSDTEVKGKTDFCAVMPYLVYLDVNQSRRKASRPLQVEPNSIGRVV